MDKLTTILKQPCFSSPLPVLVPSSCLLPKNLKSYSLEYVLKDSSMVRYPFYVLQLVPLLNMFPLELELFLGLGLYSGIFVIYLQCTSKMSRTQIILFYALCILYVLSTATIVGDLINLIFEVSDNSICMIFF